MAFYRKVYTTDKRKAPSVAWLGLIETDSILIREKRKHLSKTSDRVSKMFWSESAQGLNEGKYS
jgi:hypothetical protein